MLRHQLIRYLLVGGLGTVAHLMVLVISVELAGLSATWGAVLGYLCALLISFIFNHKWTFSSKKSYLSSFPKYVLVSVSGLVLNAMMVSGLVNHFGWWYLSAQLIVIWVVPITNYLLNKYWSFEVKSKDFVERKKENHE